jgi:hypothetical protein
MIIAKEGYNLGGIRREDAEYAFSCPMDGVAQDWVWAGGRLFNVHLPNRRRDGVYGIRWEERPGRRSSLKTVLDELKELIQDDIEDIEYRCNLEGSTLLKFINLDWSVEVYNRYADALRLKWALKKAPLIKQLEAVDNWFK